MIELTCPHCGTETSVPEADAFELGVIRVFYDGERQRAEAAFGLWFTCPACTEITGVVTAVEERDA